MLDIFPCAYASLNWVAHYKALPEDFKVRENLSFAFEENEGEHLYLLIEKRALTTDWVAKMLARYFDVSLRDVGFAGKKDKWALTEQWFSVWLPGKAQNMILTSLTDFSENCRLLKARWHRAKLRKGAIEKNDFEIIVRSHQPPDKLAIENRLTQIKNMGFPNYYGSQRFGVNGNNIEQAKNWFDRKIKVKKNTQGILISAVRSYLFNLILAKRIELNNWDQPVSGDCFILEGSRRYFTSEELIPENKARCQEKDIHPSAALWGRGRNDAKLDALQIESSVIQEFKNLCEPLEFKGVAIDRRALRAMPQNLVWKWGDDNQLKLQFSLPSGTYATSLLKEMGLPLNLVDGNSW